MAWVVSSPFRSPLICIRSPQPGYWPPFGDEGNSARVVESSGGPGGRIPRILLAVPLVAAGLLLPAFSNTPDTPAAVVIGMAHEGFVPPGADDEDVAVGDVPAITIH